MKTDTELKQLLAKMLPGDRVFLLWNGEDKISKETMTSILLDSTAQAVLQVAQSVHKHVSKMTKAERGDLLHIADEQSLNQAESVRMACKIVKEACKALE